MYSLRVGNGVDATTSVDDKLNSDEQYFSISPNPVHSVLTITMNLQVNLWVQSDIIIEIYIVLGEVVKGQALTGSLSLNQSVDVSSLSPGIYYISLRYGREGITKLFAVVQ